VQLVLRCHLRSSRLIFRWDSLGSLSTALSAQAMTMHQTGGRLVINLLDDVPVRADDFVQTTKFY
jgi:hypothetical protein